MRRLSTALLSLAVTIASGCGGKKVEKAGEPSASAAPSAAIVPPAVGASAGPVVKTTIPALIPERLRRPLTDKEIMALPPETRDMILRAQGKPVPTPTKKR